MYPDLICTQKGSVLSIVMPFCTGLLDGGGGVGGGALDAVGRDAGLDAGRGDAAARCSVVSMVRLPSKDSGSRSSR